MDLKLNYKRGFGGSIFGGDGGIFNPETVTSSFLGVKGTSPSIFFAGAGDRVGAGDGWLEKVGAIGAPYLTELFCVSKVVDGVGAIFFS